MSDHRTIQFSFKRNKIAPIRCRNIKRTNWSLYDVELCASVGLWFGQFKTSDDVERELENVNFAILNVYLKACPERRILRRHKVPWWNHELKVLRAKASKAFHKGYQTKLEEDWQAYCQARRALKKEFR